jgi:hypothetical protein
MYPRLDAATERAVAVDAEADPRTVRNITRGGKARGMVDGRVRRALAARGIVVPCPPTDSSSTATESP